MSAIQIREQFERHFTIPDGVYWDSDAQQYEHSSGNDDVAEAYHNKFVGFQVALQSLEGEAVGGIQSDFEREIIKVAEAFGYPHINKLLVKHGDEDSQFYVISWVESAWLVWQEAYKLYTKTQPHAEQRKELAGDFQTTRLMAAKELFKDGNYVHAFNHLDSAIKCAQEQALAVPDGWKNSASGEHFPSIGEKYLIRIGPDLVLQNETYEFDQSDDGNGGGEYFWGRDDVDECPKFDWERDLWMPLKDVTVSMQPKVLDGYVMMEVGCVPDFVLDAALRDYRLVKQLDGDDDRTPVLAAISAGLLAAAQQGGDHA